jgi:hypothetical protein
LQDQTDKLMSELPARFFEELISPDEVQDEAKSAIKTQRIQNGIEAQSAVFRISGETWSQILVKGQEKRLYSPKEIGVLQVAARIPEKIPTEKQSFVLLDILEKARLEAIYQE